MMASVPWSQYEKRFLLAEIIKTSAVSLDSLLRIVKEENVQPNWNEIFLPHARNVNACRAVFSDLLANSPASFQQHPHHFEATPPISKKRRHSDSEPVPSNVRALKPKPAENSEQGNAFRSSSGNALPKKRGRPSKEEIAQRQAEAIARGEVYPPPKPPVRKSIGSAPTANPNFNAGPFEAILPGESIEAPGSAQKKRRGRPLKDETLETIITEPPAVAGDIGIEKTTFERSHENEEKIHEAAPQPPAQSSAEIPDSNASSNTLIPASGPI